MFVALVIVNDQDLGQVKLDMGQTRRDNEENKTERGKDRR